MITPDAIPTYQGAAISRGSDSLYVLPHPLLRPYISCYTVTMPHNIPDAYTVLPSASATLVFSIGSGGISARLRGVDTQPVNIGAHANKMQLLLLIEFRPGCLAPFIRNEPAELLDRYVELDLLDKTLKTAVEHTLLQSGSVEALFASLDPIFINRVQSFTETSIAPMLSAVISQNGLIGARELSAAFYYSEKHIRRLFLRHMGISPKQFARVVRVNHALQLLRVHPAHFADVAAQAGFFDQPHLNHEFKAVCGLTPSEYIRNRSVFYNDNLKLVL